MKAIDRKLVRDLGRLKGQVITIGLVVACGIAAYVAIQGTYQSLLLVRDAYYERQRFPDVFAHLQRAPESLRERIELLPGVARAHTRVVESVRIPMPSLPEPAIGQVVSLPASGEPSLGAVMLRKGRMFEPGRQDEVVVLEAFAEAHELEIGSEIQVVIGGVQRDLRVVGIALAPEYVFSIAPGELVPDPRRFGVLWMERSVLAAAFRMEGAFNDVVLRLQPGASEAAAIEGLDRLLEPYGGLGAHGRDRQLSHNVLRGELTQLSTLTAIMPTIFLGVAAFLINVVLSRLVQIQRAQVAALKAVGYTRREIGAHYLKLVCVIVLSGSLLGVGAGVWLGELFTGLYRQFFHFPSLRYQLGLRVISLAVASGLLAAVVGALSAVRAVMKLPAAEAMRPEPPATYRHSIVDRIRVGFLFGQSARMILREIRRRPMRLVLSSLGVAMAVAVLVSGRFNVDAVEWFMTVQFELAQREDLTVAFRRSVPRAAISELEHLPGVRRAEGLRTVSVRIVSGHRSRETVLFGHPEGAQLRRVLDREGRAVEPPERGVLISSALADILEVEAGDSITIEVLEGERGRYQVPISGTVKDVYGLFGYMEANSLSRLLGDEGRVSMALLSVDPQARGALQRALTERPEVLGVSRREAVIDMFRKQTAGQIQFTTLIITLFAVVIASGVIYNNARIALSTRSRDLASLRVLGFRRREVSAILLGELAIQVLLALLPGMYLGRLIAETMMANADPEVYRFPVVISARTYAFAALVTLAASLASALVVRNRIDRLDLIGVLKSRD